MIHGGDILGASLESNIPVDKLLDYSSNISPLGIPKNVWNALFRSSDSILQYPDPLCRKLTDAIAVSEQVDKEYILCGGGGADLIYRYAYAEHPKKVLLPAPAFAEYEEALTQVHSEFVYFYMQPEGLSKPDLMQILEGGADAMFLCNPNNPTGLMTSKEQILELLEITKAKKIRFFLDECFLDYTEDPDAYTLKSYLSRYPNLVILRSFTKMFAMPGLRLGYVMTSDRVLIEKMRLAGQPWAVGGLAMEAGIAALEDPSIPVRTREIVKRERAYLKKALEDKGYFVLDGKANYLCFKAGEDKCLYEKMLKKGIIIRRCSNYRTMDETWYRIAVRDHENNEVFVKVLSEV